MERSETLDGTLSFEAKLERIVKLANCVTASLASSLFHAHVACLSARELCDAILLTLESNEPLRRAPRGRLIRLAREGVVATEVERLAKGLLDISTAGTHKRQRVDAILSQLYPHLSPPTRSDVLQHWKSRGTRSAGARWLKAIRDDALLFGIEEVLGYWRASLNEDAAILLGQLGMWGTLERVREVLAELERDLVATIGIDTQPSHASAVTRVEDGQRDNDNDGQDKPD